MHGMMLRPSGAVEVHSKIVVHIWRKHDLQISVLTGAQLTGPFLQILEGDLVCMAQGDLLCILGLALLMP